MKSTRAASFTLLALFATSTLAATPVKMARQADQETSDGVPYTTYLVSCSDSSEKMLTVWEDGKKWCIGDTTSTECEKKKIKAAKKACR